LVVEADVAAGIDDYGGEAWPELMVSMAPGPTDRVVDGLYAYGYFGRFYTFGCRLQSSRVPICALYDDTGRSVGQGGRVFETSFFQPIGRITFGGGPFNPELDAAWRRCAGTDPDENCRDRFRLELTQDSLNLYVNGVLYFRQAEIVPDKQFPAEMLNGDVYVYFADMIYKPAADTVRFHWQRLAVNPGDSRPTSR
jgi:hypothetical protein